MRLPVDGSEFEIGDRFVLAATYRVDDAGPGNLTLRIRDAGLRNEKENSIVLERWSPEGFEIYEWPEACGLVICGADRIVMLDLSSLRVAAAIALEYEECETVGSPWFVNVSDVLIVSTESRVFCFDRRLGIRWCWTTRAYSKEWWSIVRSPVVEGEVVRVSLGLIMREAEIRLSVWDALCLES